MYKNSLITLESARKPARTRVSKNVIRHNCDKGVSDVGMSEYYKNLRDSIGNQLLFMPAVAGIIRNNEGKILFGRKHGELNWGLDN